MNVLSQGGKAAIEALKELKGEENITSEEIQAAYLAQVNRLQSAIEQVTEMTVGSIITGDLIRILRAAGGEVHELGDGTAVVTRMTNLVDVYLRIYREMEATGEATTAQLNSVFASMLTARDQTNIDAISTLNNAMGMSYDELGTLLA